MSLGTTLAWKVQILLLQVKQSGYVQYGKPGKVMEFEKSISRPGEVIEN